MSSGKIKTGGNIGAIKHGMHESVYEVHLEKLLEEAREKLKRLKADLNTIPEQLREVEEEIQALESLHDNYDEAMDVFRRT